MCDRAVSCKCGLIYVETITVMLLSSRRWVTRLVGEWSSYVGASDYVAAVMVLRYTNNETASCEISGTVQPVIVEAWDECGGTITITWDTTVTCNYGLNFFYNDTATPEIYTLFLHDALPTSILCADAASYVAAVTV